MQARIAKNAAQAYNWSPQEFAKFVRERSSGTARSSSGRGPSRSIDAGGMGTGTALKRAVLTAMPDGSTLNNPNPGRARGGTPCRTVIASSIRLPRPNSASKRCRPRSMRTALKASEAVEELDHLAQEQWVPRNGARVVARAWTDPAFRARLLTDGRGAVAELGVAMPSHHRHLVVLENTPTVQNVICCTQCSCTAFTVIGLPPDWYKDLEYRSRIVRESRTVLKQMGLDLPPEVQIRVWDTTTDTRYMVLPVQPPETIGLSEDELADIVTRDSMIGVSRL